MRPFRLPGGERAAREPWRAALALCWEAGTAWPEGEERGGEVLRHAFTGRVNTPVTTSVGRLFDAAAALLGVCVTSSYEAEAAMRLEALCEGRAAPWELPLARDETGLWRSDWAPLLPALLDRTCTVAGRAARFHATMAHVLLAQARAIREDTGIERVGLTGGVFQNRVLTSQARELLCDAEFTVLIPERLPLNDAALSVGQIIEAGALHAVG
jgi:hydrogenase maturation protein HypF